MSAKVIAARNIASHGIATKNIPNTKKESTCATR